MISNQSQLILKQIAEKPSYLEWESNLRRYKKHLKIIFGLLIDDSFDMQLMAMRNGVDPSQQFNIQGQAKHKYQEIIESEALQQCVDELIKQQQTNMEQKASLSERRKTLDPRQLLIADSPMPLTQASTPSNLNSNRQYARNPLQNQELNVNQHYYAVQEPQIMSNIIQNQAQCVPNKQRSQNELKRQSNPLSHIPNQFLDYNLNHSVSTNCSNLKQNNSINEVTFLNPNQNYIASAKSKNIPDLNTRNNSSQLQSSMRSNQQVQNQKSMSSYEIEQQKISALQQELQKLKGKQKTAYYNNLVYSTFSYPKGSQSFYKEKRMSTSSNGVRETDLPSPGPGSYQELSQYQSLSTKRSSLGPASFNKASKDALNDRSCSPGVGSYTPRYHAIN